MPPSGPNKKSPIRRTERGIYNVTNWRQGTKAIEQMVTTPSGTWYSSSLNSILANNAHSIGICYEGGLDEKGRDADTRTPAQRAALIALLRSLMVDYPDARIMGHCELEGVHKACPCFSCQEYRDYFANL